MSPYCTSAVSRNDVNHPEHEILRELQFPFILVAKNPLMTHCQRGTWASPARQFPLHSYLTFRDMSSFEGSLLGTHQPPLTHCEVRHSETDGASPLTIILWISSVSTYVKGSSEEAAFCCYLPNSSALCEGLQKYWGLDPLRPTKVGRAQWEGYDPNIQKQPGRYLLRNPTNIKASFIKLFPIALFTTMEKNWETAWRTKREEL